MNVNPRYTPGSPDVVESDIALRVARAEHEAYGVALSGIYGETEQRKAHLLGLGGIVETLHEHTSKKAWYVSDVITKATHWKPFALAIKRGDWHQLYIDSLGEYDSFIAVDYDGSYWRFPVKPGGFAERVKIGDFAEQRAAWERIPAYLAWGTDYPPAEGREAQEAFDAAHAERDKCLGEAHRSDVPELA